MSIELKKFDTRMQAEGPEVRHLDPHNAPYYLPIGDEVEIFEAAYKARLPVLLKGPTGCGKTRFVEHMAHRLAHLGRRQGYGVAAEIDHLSPPLLRKDRLHHFVDRALAVGLVGQRPGHGDGRGAARRDSLAD